VEAGEGEALRHARLRTCLGLSGPDPHGPLRVNSGEGERCRSGRAGCLDPVAGLIAIFMIRGNCINKKTRPAGRRAEAPAAALVGISVRNTHDPELRADAMGAWVLSPTRARGISGDNTPHPPQADLIPEPDRRREEEALKHAYLPACPDLLGPGPHGPLRIKLRGGEGPRSAHAGCLDPVAGSAISIYSISSSGKHKNIRAAP
jgi:hypothetical protein